MNICDNSVLPTEQAGISASSGITAERFLSTAIRVQGQQSTDEQIISRYLRLRLTNENHRGSFLSALRRLTWYLSHHDRSDVSTLSDIDSEIVHSFLHWARNPAPEDCNPGKPAYLLPNGSPNPAWRPLTGAASRTSLLSLQSVLSSFWRFAKEQQDSSIEYNPWILNVDSVAPKGRAASASQRRHMPVRAMQLVFEYLRHHHEAPVAQFAQKQFLAHLLYLTSARISSLLEARTTDIVTIAGVRQLRLTVKGGGVHCVPWIPAMQQALVHYRSLIGASPVRPWLETDEPLFLHAQPGRRRTGEGYSRSHAFRLAKALFHETAGWAESRGGHEAWVVNLLRQASPHWARHGVLSTVANGIEDITVAQHLAGHSSQDTTELYRQKQLEEAGSALGILYDLIRAG